VEYLEKKGYVRGGGGRVRGSQWKSWIFYGKSPYGSISDLQIEEIMSQACEKSEMKRPTSQGFLVLCTVRVGFSLQ
jgi:hypothetical protein